MINLIEIEKFAGIDKFKVSDISGKNILIYGPNGSGKSSIIDSLYYLKEREVEISKKGRNQNDCLSFCGCGENLIKIFIGLGKEDFIKRENGGKTEFSKDDNVAYLQNIQILRKDNLQKFLQENDADRYRSFLSLMGLESLTFKLRSFENKLVDLKNIINEKQNRINNKLSSVRFANLEGENFDQIKKQYLDKVSVEFNEYEAGDSLEMLKEKYNKIVNEKTKENIRIINGNLINIDSSFGQEDVEALSNLIEEAKKLSQLRKKFPESYLLSLMNEAISVFDSYQFTSCPICNNENGFNQKEVYDALCEKRNLLNEIIKSKELINSLISTNDLRSKVDNAILVDKNIFGGKYGNDLIIIKSFLTNFEGEEIGNQSIESIKNYSDEKKQKKAELSREMNKLINNKVEVLSSINDLLLKDENNWVTLEDGLKRNKSDEMILENLRKLLIDSRDYVINEIFEQIEGETIHLYKKMNQDEKELKEFKLKKLRASSLQLGIDFLNFEKVDPLSVLSTGHLDFFGLSMFLATIKTFYPAQTLIVLEDVIDSNDNEHKSNFMECILDEFNDYRFIVTTHLSSFYETFKDQITSREINKKWATIELGEWDGNVGVNILRCNSEVLMGGNHIIFIDANLNRDNYKNIGGALRKLNEIFLKKVSDKKKIQVRYNKRQQFTSGDFMNNELKRELKKDLVSNGISEADADTLMNDYFGNQKIINWLSHDSAVGDELAFSEVEKFVKALKLLISKEREFKALP